MARFEATLDYESKIPCPECRVTKYLVRAEIFNSDGYCSEFKVCSECLISSISDLDRVIEVTTPS